MFKKIMVLVLSVGAVITITNCNDKIIKKDNKKVIVIPTDPTKKIQKNEIQLEDIPNDVKYKVIIEKKNKVLINLFGRKFWAKINTNNIPVSPKTNEYGFCEIKNNNTKVYYEPSINSPQITSLSKGTLVRVLDKLSFFIKVSTPNLNQKGYIFKSDLKDYTYYDQPKNLPKVNLKQDKNYIYLSKNGKISKIKKGTLPSNISPKFNDDKSLLRYVDEIKKRSVLLSSKNISEYKDTFENFPFYASNINRNITNKNNELYYYERAKILYTSKNTNNFILDKTFILISKNESPYKYFTTDIAGDLPFLNRKIEFYNQYGEKTGEWFGRVFNYKVTSDEKYFLIGDGDKYVPNKGLVGVTKSFFDMNGRLIKNVFNAASIRDKYYYTMNSDIFKKVNVKVYSILKDNPIMHIKRNSTPKGYGIFFSNYPKDKSYFFGEAWLVDINIEHVILYGFNGKIIKEYTGKVRYK